MLGWVLSLATTKVANWFVMTDELYYERLAISVAHTGSLLPRLHGEVISNVNQLYPVLLSLVYGNVIQHATFVLGLTVDTPAQCTFLPAVAGTGGRNRLANGIQIFPGGVPIYRGATLVGGIGVSGDGIDQDDMISFLGVHRAGLRVGSIGNASPAIRADQVVVNGTRLRYVSCPFAPFLDSSEQNACQGK